MLPLLRGATGAALAPRCRAAAAARHALPGVVRLGWAAATRPACAPLSTECAPEEGPGIEPAAGGAQGRHTVVRHSPHPGSEPPPLPAGCEAKFAVIRLGGTQYKVTKDDVIVADKVENAEIGTTLRVPDVLLVGTREETVVGLPVVPGASVELLVEEQTKDAKVIAFKKRRRKSSQRTKGHRRQVTLLRVLGIES